jgi:hypothetical protein
MPIKVNDGYRSMQLNAFNIEQVEKFFSNNYNMTRTDYELRLINNY